MTGIAFLIRANRHPVRAWTLAPAWRVRLQGLVFSILLGCLAGLSASPALAGDVIVLDDSRTYTEPPSIAMQWRQQTPANPSGGMEAWLKVNVHVSTAEHAGQRGRIYLSMPQDENGTLEATWQSRGILRAGQLSTGERTLVFAGTLPASALVDQLSMRLRSGNDWRSDSRRVRMQFELELD